MVRAPAPAGAALDSGCHVAEGTLRGLVPLWND